LVAVALKRPTGKILSGKKHARRCNSMNGFDHRILRPAPMSGRCPITAQSAKDFQPKTLVRHG
jgi:hypothetical protein